MFELPGYSDVRQIGAGGMALVYRATQVSFKRQVAIKVLMPTYASDSQFAERFLREAETVASLSHPHIIPVYDFGQRDGTFYMVMEFLTGGDLMQWIHRGLEEEEVLQIISDVASALHFAHEKGYVHRDVKPDNIMFREDNSAVLTDFGIARQKNANNQVTVAGSILGTPKYMSPEQLQGHPVDGRSDIYSLGIMFYEMLTKQAPYQDEEFMALAMKHLQSPIPKLPIRYSKFQKLFEKMVAKKPEDRFQTGLEIVKLVQQYRSGKFDAVNVSTVSEVSVAQTFSGVSTGTVGSNVNSALKKLANRQIGEPLPDVKEGMHSEELKPRGVVFKSYDYSSRMVALEWMRLSMMLSTCNTKLLNWYHERGGQCGKAYLSVTTMPEHFETVTNAIKQWGAIDSCKFLKKTGVELTLIDAKTKAERIERIKF